MNDAVVRYSYLLDSRSDHFPLLRWLELPEILLEPLEKLRYFIFLDRFAGIAGFLRFEVRNGLVQLLAELF